MDDMAEFLKQEQAALGELGDNDFANELGGGDNPFGFGEEIEDLGNEGEFGDFGMGQGASNPAPPTSAPTEKIDDTYQAFSSSMDGDFGGGPTNNYEAELSHEIASMSTGTKPAHIDPSITHAWKKAQEERIKEIDGNSVRKEAEMRSKAKSDLETFLKSYDEGLKGNKMAGTAATLADAGGNEDINKPQWNKISDICDFKSQKSANGKERMKTLLLSLKDEPLSR